MWSARHHLAEEPVAIKRVKEVFKGTCDARMALQEMRVLRAASEHPNIVKLQTVLRPECEHSYDDLYLVMDRLDADLELVIHKGPTQSLLSVQSIGLGILNGLRHLHGLRVLHRDLKPGNVLVSRGGDIKLCDFGLSRGFSQDEWRVVSLEAREAFFENLRAAKRKRVRCSGQTA